MDLTTRLGFRKPLGTEDYNIDDQNYNWDRADTFAGRVVCTSTTRPSSPFTGMAIYETDTKLRWFWDGSAWVVEPSGALGGYWYGAANNTLTTMSNNTNEQLTGMETPSLTLADGMCYRIRFKPSYDNVTGGKLTFRIRMADLSGTIVGTRGPIAQVAAADQQQDEIDGIIFTSGTGTYKFVLTAQRGATNATVPHFYRSTTYRPYAFVEHLAPTGNFASA